MNATYHLPCWCTCSLRLPPTFPFRSGTMGAPLRVQVWGRRTENTPRWVSKLLFHSLMLHYASLTSLLCILRNNRSKLCCESVCVCVCVCVHARVCLCLIGIVSISKGPDSHPPSPCETKAGQLMMPWMSLDQLSHVYERQAASVRDTVNVLPLEVLRVAALNTGICWLNYWWHWRMISVNKWDHCEHLSDTSGIVNASVSQD